VRARDLEQQTRRQQDEEHHPHHHRTPVSHLRALLRPRAREDLTASSTRETPERKRVEWGCGI
jgi:cell division protein FtsB